MSDQDKIQDYDRLKYEYTQLHQDYKSIKRELNTIKTMNKKELTIEEINNLEVIHSVVKPCECDECNCNS